MSSAAVVISSVSIKCLKKGWKQNLKAESLILLVTRNWL